MKKRGKKKKGFTLIELLVVIAIIGLLATLAVVSMSSARAKARDAKRVSDVRQMSTILDVEDAATPGSNLITCIGAHADTTTCNAPGDVNQFNKFIDPLSSSNSAVCNTAGSVAGCKYSIATMAGGAGAKTNDYQICFYLEQAVNGVGTNGIHQIEPGGIFNSGCE